jgi:hypothetical protein
MDPQLEVVFEARYAWENAAGPERTELRRDYHRLLVEALAKAGLKEPRARNSKMRSPMRSASFVEPSGWRNAQDFRGFAERFSSFARQRFLVLKPWVWIPRTRTEMKPLVAGALARNRTFSLVFERSMSYFAAMNRPGTSWLAPVCGAALVVSTLPSFADTAPRSYDSIVARNAFGLKPKSEPPPPPPEPEKPGNLKLTGISTMFGNKKAHLMLLEHGKGNPKFYSLPIASADGPETDGLRVLDIDEKAGSVKVRFNEKELLMTFEKDGLTNTPAPVMATAVARGPGNLPTPGATYTAPGTPPIPGAARPSEGLKSIPTRTIRAAVEPQPGSVAGLSLTTAGQDGVAQVWNNPNTASLAVSARDRLRNRQVTPPASHPPDSDLTAEEAMVLMEVEREVRKPEIEAGLFPPLPPTPLSPEFKTGATVPTPTGPGGIPLPPTPGNP